MTDTPPPLDPRAVFSEDEIRAIIDGKVEPMFDTTDDEDPAVSPNGKEAQ